MAFENGPIKDGNSICFFAMHECLYISFVLVVTSQFGERTNGIPIFHWTVLEGHWELEARTGTKITAAVCTFRYCCCFRHRNSHFFAKFEKHWKCRAKTRLCPSVFWWNRREKSRNTENGDMSTFRNGNDVRRAEVHQIWRESGQ